MDSKVNFSGICKYTLLLFAMQFFAFIFLIGSIILVCVKNDYWLNWLLTGGIIYIFCYLLSILLNLIIFLLIWKESKDNIKKDPFKKYFFWIWIPFAQYKCIPICFKVIKDDKTKLTDINNSIKI